MAPVLVALPAFLISLAITLRAAERFAERLDRLGTRFGLSEALVGLLTALAADGPEISSALVALSKGARTASVGVLVGSNVFNLAAMIGVSALVAGCVRLPRNSLALEGLVGFLVTIVAAAVLLHALAPIAGAALMLLVLAPYLAVVVGGSTEAPPTSAPATLWCRRRARAHPGVARAVGCPTSARGRPHRARGGPDRARKLRHGAIRPHPR